MEQKELVDNIIAQLYGGMTPKEEHYNFPLYIRSKETKLIYKLLTSYEDRPSCRAVMWKNSKSKSLKRYIKQLKTQFEVKGKE